MSEAMDVQAYKAHQAREAAFEHWWSLTSHLMRPEARKALAREAYFAAWGGGAQQALRAAQHVYTLSGTEVVVSHKDFPPVIYNFETGQGRPLVLAVEQGSRET